MWIVECVTEQIRYQPTNRPTNQPTDTASYRGALSHLKTMKNKAHLHKFTVIKDVPGLPTMLCPAMPCGQKVCLGELSLISSNLIYFQMHDYKKTYITMGEYIYHSMPAVSRNMP